MQYVVDANGARPTPVVGVDNVCAWPNLTVLGDGTIVASIHNKPSHLREPASMECWAYEGDGEPWRLLGTPAPSDDGKVARGNVAAGIAGNGDLVVLTSGWSDPTGPDRGEVLPPVVSRSSDGGHTWDIKP